VQLVENEVDVLSNYFKVDMYWVFSSISDTTDTVVVDVNPFEDRPLLVNPVISNLLIFLWVEVFGLLEFAYSSLIYALIVAFNFGLSRMT
jgi:hypothetical protein